jgi:ankyrin repeat protein
MSKAALLDSIRQLKLDGAKQLLAAKPALSGGTDRQGRNLLHVACSASPGALGVSGSTQVRVVGWLLEQGFRIDEPFGRDRCTPLFLAVARARNPRLVSFLIQRGASPAAAPGHGLFAAGWWDDVKSLELLLNGGARIDIVVGVTPFLAAWCWERFRAAKFLALRGADVNVRDPQGRTALRYGIEKEFDPALLRWLVRHGASPDIEARDGITPRERASRKRDKRFAAAVK